MKRPVRILILDDHELVRKGLRTFLDREPDLLVVGEAGTLADALPLVARLHPHLILLDMKLPDVSGIESCRRLLAAAPNLRVLVLTGHAEATTVAAAIKSGAHGYILKDVKLDDLAQAIRAVAAGRGYLDPRITQYALHWIRAGVSQASPLQGLSALSPQERLIMPLLAQGKTNKEIATQLKLSDKTVKNYLVNIYTKLNVNRRTEAVAWFMRECPSSETANPISPSA
jgi:DNA-binding NarL/FixJ family response regulator